MHTPTLAEFAEEALLIIPSARYWTKGADYGGRYDERSCLVGALERAAWNLQTARGLPSQHWLRDVYDALLAIIEEQYPHAIASIRSYAKELDSLNEQPAAACIVGFNDMRSTHYPDVRLVLEKLRAS